MGKGTIGKQLLARDPHLTWSVSGDTLSRVPVRWTASTIASSAADDFVALRDAGGLLEWFEVYGQLKGTPREPVEDGPAGGQRRADGGGRPGRDGYGVPPTERNARTGEFTPPGMTSPAAREQLPRSVVIGLTQQPRRARGRSR